VTPVRDGSRVRGDRGSSVVLPSWAVALSAVVVVLAMVGFVVAGDREPDVAAASDSSSKRADPSDSANDSAQTEEGGSPGAEGDKRRSDPPKAVRPVERRTAYVEVYNNSSITGLAEQTAGTLQGVGWRVVTTDNWYGEIPTTTVYYPAEMRDDARLLADDLDIDRVKRAVSPMSFDRLTVIVTSAG
jgi:hypothetical protein